MQESENHSLSSENKIPGNAILSVTDKGKIAILEYEMRRQTYTAIFLSIAVGFLGIALIVHLLLK